jgi:uncharacterized repeat protein (TIGR04076 family)|tara:strand:+ start:2283 stop:2813 length:531 start_codon:yes stop_codon:yes gene_type:complete
MGMLKIKQNPVKECHECPWHQANENGKEYQSEEILPQNVCPWLYHTLYPYFLGLLYGAKFDYNDKGDCHVCCPATHGVDLVVKRRENDGNIHKEVSDDMKFAIFADVVKVNGDCPSNHKAGDRFVFPTVKKEAYLCTAGFNHTFPLMDIEKPSCLNKKAVKCPDWKNPVFFDVDNQ